jgi:LIM domain
VCTACGEAVFLAERLRLSGRTFHRRCFRCARCGAQLSPANCYETESRAFCCEVCPDEVRGEFSDDDEDDAHAAAPTKEAALAAVTDVHDEYSVSFESALDDESAHPVTSAPDLDMISAHSSTNQQKHPASPGPGDGAAASGGGLVSSRRSLFENIETASGGERRTLVKDEIIAAQKDVVTEEDKENCQQDVEVKAEENIDDEKKVATIAIREFLNLDDEVKDDIPDMDAQEVPTTEPPVLPKSEPPELPKTEPPPLVTRPEKTESGLDESSEVKPTPPLRPPPPISIDNDVNSGTVCIPSSASTNDKTSTSDDEASTTKESVTNSSDQKMNEPIVPEILVEKVDDQIYPDDLNPFGDDDEPPVEKKPAPRRVVSLNPFGSDSEEEEEEKKPTPRKLIPVEPCLNPFGDDEEEDEPVKTRTPVPRPRSFNT